MHQGYLDHLELIFLDKLLLLCNFHHKLIPFQFCNLHFHFQNHNHHPLKKQLYLKIQKK